MFFSSHQVQVEVELGSRVLRLSVTPTQATILYHFQTKPRWTIPELHIATEVMDDAQLIRDECPCGI